MGAAGTNPSSVGVKALGTEVTAVSGPEVAADGSSLTFTVTVTPVDIRKAYRISAVSQINILIQVTVEDNAGNNIGGEVNFAFDSPSSGLANAAGKPGEKTGHVLRWRRLIQEIVINNGLHKVFDPDSHDSPNPQPGPSDDPYDIALNGGRHSGKLQEYQRLPAAKVFKAISSLERQIAVHEGYVADPRSHDRGWDNKAPVAQAGLINHWQKEIKNFKELVYIARRVLIERGELS